MPYGMNLRRNFRTRGWKLHSCLAADRAHKTSYRFTSKASNNNEPKQDLLPIKLALIIRSSLHIFLTIYTIIYLPSYKEKSKQHTKKFFPNFRSFVSSSSVAPISESSQKPSTESTSSNTAQYTEEELKARSSRRQRRYHGRGHGHDHLLSAFVFCFWRKIVLRSKIFLRPNNPKRSDGFVAIYCPGPGGNATL